MIKTIAAALVLMSVSVASASPADPHLLKMINTETGEVTMLGLMVNQRACLMVAQRLTQYAAVPPVEPFTFVCIQSVQA